MNIKRQIQIFIFQYLFTEPIKNVFCSSILFLISSIYIKHIKTALKIKLIYFAIHMLPFLLRRVFSLKKKRIEIRHPDYIYQPTLDFVVKFIQPKVGYKLLKRSKNDFFLLNLEIVEKHISSPNFHRMCVYSIGKF